MKYTIYPLKARCVNYLLDNLDVENVLPVLKHCLDCVVDDRLVEKCRELLRSNIENVLKPEFIATMDENCLICLLEDEDLDVEEINLFNAVCFFIFCYVNLNSNKYVLTKDENCPINVFRYKKRNPQFILYKKSTASSAPDLRGG